jgi:hypothetical protein
VGRSGGTSCEGAQPATRALSILRPSVLSHARSQCPQLLGHLGAMAQAAAHEEARRKGFAHMAYQHGLTRGYWGTHHDARPSMPDSHTLPGQGGSF